MNRYKPIEPSTHTVQDECVCVCHADVQAVTWCAYITAALVSSGRADYTPALNRPRWGNLGSAAGSLAAGHRRVMTERRQWPVAPPSPPRPTPPRPAAAKGQPTAKVGVEAMNVTVFRNCEIWSRRNLVTAILPSHWTVNKHFYKDRFSLS